MEDVEVIVVGVEVVEVVEVGRVEAVVVAVDDVEDVEVVTVGVEDVVVVSVWVVDVEDIHDDVEVAVVVGFSDDVDVTVEYVAVNRADTGWTGLTSLDCPHLASTTPDP